MLSKLTSKKLNLSEFVSCRRHRLHLMYWN